MIFANQVFVVVNSDKLHYQYDLEYVSINLGMIMGTLEEFVAFRYGPRIETRLGVRPNTKTDLTFPLASVITIKEMKRIMSQREAF